MIVSTDGRETPIQCVTPCKVFLPQGMGVRVGVTMEGYELAAPQPQLQWVEKKGAWWQGNMGSTLVPNSVLYKLKPITTSP